LRVAGYRSASGRQAGGKGAKRVATKVSLTGHISIEAHGVVIDEQRFPGRQGRLVFAYLLAKEGRPVPTDELAEAIWADELPARWEKALSVLASKLRALLNECGIDGATSLTSAFGCYQLTLPAGTWIDVAAAEEAATAADRALAAADLEEAQANASTAKSLARRSFLPGEDGRWIEDERARLREILVRALECLSDAHRLSGDPSAAARAADELVTLEPFRERGYRLLMQAQSAAGNDAEALRTYERCRTLLAEELGAYPSPQTESIYRELLEAPAAQAGPTAPSEALSNLPPLATNKPPRPNRRKRAGLGALALLVLGASALAFVLASRDGAPPVVQPNSLVRLDPRTLEPTDVIPIGVKPDIVIAAGGFLWVTHNVLRDVDSGALRDAGDWRLTRVDPSTGDAEVVGGGLAPCGLPADPSGDVWVANCFAPGSRPSANLVRIDAKTLDFKEKWPVPSGDGFYRGLAYGGGLLWVSGVAGGEHPLTRILTQVDPRTGARRSIRLADPATPLAWSERYGDLWMSNFTVGTVSRMPAATRVVETVDAGVTSPGFVAFDGDGVWVPDWDAPRVARLSAVGSGRPRIVSLPVRNPTAGVWKVAAGAGGVWATTPRDGALWRIDPKTNAVTRITVPHLPTFVTVADDDLWLTVRAG
ncbi:MAG: hypothetical protein M3P42_07985, partial [Actinomycetota bacterium]|nr:hypothetical protein [Actinomycetota bacterium]